MTPTHARGFFRLARHLSLAAGPLDCAVIEARQLPLSDEDAQALREAVRLVASVRAGVRRRMAEAEAALSLTPRDVVPIRPEVGPPLLREPEE